MIGWMVGVIGALIVSVASAIWYALHERGKRRDAEIKAEQREIELQGWVEYGQRMNDAIAENIKRQAQVEQDLRDGKRDNFERDY